MKKSINYLIVFAAGIGFGATLSVVGAAENTPKPAYMIVSSDRNPGVTNADYAPYQQAAGPLARAAGLTMTAGAQEPVVLEGNWPFRNVMLERYDSMEALQTFWNSDDYQAAKKMREGLSTVNFIIAIEGQ